MRRYLVLVLMMMAVAVAQNGTCDVEMGNVVIGQHPACADGVAPEDAEVYASESFYVCAEFDTATGLVIASEDSIVSTKAVPLQNGMVIVNGLADTQQHKTYYITLNMSSPCEKVFTIPLEIKNKCTQLPPSTIQIVPNAITKGENFVLEVANAPKDLDMTITGLLSPVSAKIMQGEHWTRSFGSEECPEGCELRFSFTDPRHPSCSNEDTRISLRVLPEAEEPEENGESMDSLMIAILGIVIIGMAVTVAFALR